MKTSRLSFKKSALMRRVIGVGCTTLVSRLFGLVREILMGNFLGTGLGADLFFTAYKLPNSLRKIFAEGALSAALVPTCVQIAHEDSKKEVSKLITLSLFFFQTILLILCALIFWKAELVVRLIAPGWFVHKDSIFLSSSLPILGTFMRWIAPAWYVLEPIAPHIQPVIVYVRILIGFILCISSSALLAAALQAAHHFFIPALSPVVLNIIHLLGLSWGLWVGLSVNSFCYLIMLGGVVQAFLHMATYFYLNFDFSLPDHKTWKIFRHVLSKFFPCLLSMSIMEINLFVSTSLATYLPSGSIASIYYANRFMGIPLGVFALALSTILLPYFSKIRAYAPQRLGFYLFEATKLIWWVTLPLTLLMVFYSNQIFLTLFLSPKFTLMHAYQAGALLSIFSVGLFFFSLNKILLNVYYALHETRIVSLISLLTALSNYGLSRWLVHSWGVAGLAFSFVVASSIQSALLALWLFKQQTINFYLYPFGRFVMRVIVQVSGVFVLFFACYSLLEILLSFVLRGTLLHFCMDGYGLWLWNCPLVALFFITLFISRRVFGVKIAFLN